MQLLNPLIYKKAGAPLPAPPVTVPSTRSTLDLSVVLMLIFKA